MGGAVVSRLAIVGGGLLYPAYSSYKAVKNANVRQYVRWIMYWVVFALFTSMETFTDIFLTWLPFYYETKMIFIFWLASPYTKGSSYLYRKFIHPNLSKKEQEIDLFLENARDRGYQTMVDVGSRGFNLAANAMVTAAVKSQAVVTDKLRSYSTMDLTKLSDNMEIHGQPGSSRPGPTIVREIHQTSNNPLVTMDMHHSATAQDGSEPRLTSQFRAYSMMDLGATNMQESGLSIRSSDTDDSDNVTEFSTEPPTHTTDDMQLARRANYAQEAVPAFSRERYLTMPRRKKGSKSKTKQLPPLPSDEKTVVRRSKRKTKTPRQSYEGLPAM